MQIKKILLPTDLFNESERPYEAVRQLAEQNQAEITLIHVVEDLLLVPHGAPMAPPLHAIDLGDHKKSAEKNLKEHAERLGADHAKVLTAPRIADAIAEFARDEGFDLIAISSHGRSGFRRFVMGSVAEGVLRSSSVPVLVFPRIE